MARPPKYPWDDWLASEEPVHVDCHEHGVRPRVFQIQALQAGQRREKPVTTTACGQHPDCIVINARPKPTWNWTTLLNGNVHHVWYSELGGVQPESFIRRLREQAKKRRVSVEIDRTTNDAGILLRAVEMRVGHRITDFSPEVRYL